MGDASKTDLSEDEMNSFEEKRGEAMSALGDGEFQKAVDLFTEAIKMNAGSAAVFAKRGNAYLKLKKPNACIRDCSRAIELNPDNAAAYKFRGRANRLLGNFEEAAKDLRLACRIDYDDTANEWLQEVTPNVSDHCDSLLLERHPRDYIVVVSSFAPERTNGGDKSSIRSSMFSRNSYHFSPVVSGTSNGRD